MINSILVELKRKQILILGYGREGRAMFKYLKMHMSLANLGLADLYPQNLSDVKEKVRIFTGEKYLESLHDFDLIIKSPGIPFRELQAKAVDTKKITSQTDLFVRAFRQQIIGITGTKGKSTSVSLLQHILKEAGRNSLLVGNIGIPPFSVADKIKPDTVIIFEMSSHQLEFVENSPHISVLLNIFQEHLDHYPDFKAYGDAKWNITKFQSNEDCLYYNANDPITRKKLDYLGTNAEIRNFAFRNRKEQEDFSEQMGLKNRISLPGDHNLLNIKMVAEICRDLNISEKEIKDGVLSFKGLPHRLEFVGEFGGIRFYNDSISTIPESLIQAVRSLKDVDTLILGGKDRGLDFNKLVEFLSEEKISNLIFIGEAGHRMQQMLEKCDHQSQLFEIEKLEEIGDIIQQHTQKGKICLLSPAASSYDSFKNYEDRGNQFVNIIKKLF